LLLIDIRTFYAALCIDRNDKRCHVVMEGILAMLKKSQVEETVPFLDL